jgi:arginase
MRKVQIWGVPFDFGQEHKGVSKAYLHLRQHGLLDRIEKFLPIIDHGELRFVKRSNFLANPLINFSSSASEASKLISQRLENVDLKQDLLINIGGDHGMALGTIHGILAHHHEPVVIWVDAHGDINTPETSPTGNFHGMPLAFLLGLACGHDFNWMKRFISQERLILIGPRDLDEGEKIIIEQLGIHYFSSCDLNKFGAKEILEMALHRVDPSASRPIHLSFDVDVFDKKDFVSTGTRVIEGPKLEEIFLLGGLIAETGRLVSMDVAEFNPELGTAKDIQESTSLVLDFIEVIVNQFNLHSHETLHPEARLRLSEISQSYRVS